MIRFAKRARPARRTPGPVHFRILPDRENPRCFVFNNFLGSFRSLYSLMFILGGVAVGVIDDSFGKTRLWWARNPVRSEKLDIHGRGVASSCVIDDSGSVSFSKFCFSYCSNSAGPSARGSERGCPYLEFSLGPFGWLLGLDVCS